MTKDSLRIGWDEYFMLLAKLAACRSTCLSRPHRRGAREGQTGRRDRVQRKRPGRGALRRRRRLLPAQARRDRRGKALLVPRLTRRGQCRRTGRARGVAVDGTTLYTTLSPCFSCAKLIASAGIERVVYEHLYESANADRDKHWSDTLKEADIETTQLTVSALSIERALEFLRSDTSKRRLKSE